MIANHLLRSSLVCSMSFLRALSSDIAYWFLSSSPSSSLLCSHLPRRREGFVLVNPTVLHKVEPITHLCLNNKTLSTLQIPISTENAVKSLNYLPFPLLEISLKVNSSLTLYVSNFSGLLMWVPTSRMPSMCVSLTSSMKPFSWSCILFVSPYFLYLGTAEHVTPAIYVANNPCI